MPPIISASVSLVCPFANGHGRQAVTIPLVDFDPEHNVNATPTFTVTNNQAAIVEIIKGPSDVTIRTKAPKPVNISTATVTISDGRTKLDGSGVPPVVVTVTLVPHEDASSLEIPVGTTLTVVDVPNDAP